MGFVVDDDDTELDTNGFTIDNNSYNPTPQPQTAEDRAVQTPANPNYTDLEFKPTPRAKAEKALGDEAIQQQEAYKGYKNVLDLPASELQTFLDNASPENLREFERAQTVDRANFEEPGLGVSPMLDWIAPITGGAAGAAVGSRLTPKLVKALGRRGLTAPIKRALDRMKPDELNRLLKEMEMSKDMDLGDLILRADKDKYSEGIRPGDASSNKIEQKIFADETAAMGEKALPKAQELLQEQDTLKATTEAMTSAVKAKDAELAAPATAAYDRAKVGAGKDRNIDTSELNAEMRQYMIDELGEDAEVKSVLKILQPSGRSLTREQQAVKEGILKRERRIDAIDKKIANADDVSDEQMLKWENERSALKNENAKMEELTDMEDYNLSEAEIMGIIPKLGSKLRSNNFAFSNTANAERVLRNVRTMYMDKVEGLMGGSRRLQDLKAANKLAKKRYEYGDTAKAIEDIVHGSVKNPTQEMTNLFQTPEILNDIVDATGNKDLGPTLANELVSQIGSAKTLKKAGAGDTLDFSGTANQIESLFSDTNKKNFLKKHLPEEKYNELIASRNIYGTIGPLMKELDEVPGMWQRIKNEKGILGKTGEALKSIWDLNGWAKNRTLGWVTNKAGLDNVPGFKWTNTAVKTSDAQIKRAEKVIRKNMDKIKKGEELSEADQKVLSSFTKYVGALIGGSAGSAAGQAAQNYMTADPAPAKRKSYGAKAQLDSL